MFQIFIYLFFACICSWKVVFFRCFHKRVNGSYSNMKQMWIYTTLHRTEQKARRCCVNIYCCNKTVLRITGEPLALFGQRFPSTSHNALYCNVTGTEVAYGSILCTLLASALQHCPYSYSWAASSCSQLQLCCVYVLKMICTCVLGRVWQLDGL